MLKNLKKQPDAKRVSFYLCVAVERRKLLTKVGSS